MREALLLAQQAASLREVPVGAVLELNGRIVASAHNQSDTLVRPSLSPLSCSDARLTRSPRLPTHTA